MRSGQSEKASPYSFCPKQLFSEIMTPLILPSGPVEVVSPARNLKLFFFLPWEGMLRLGLEVFGVRMEGNSAQNLCFAVCCFVCMCGK